MSSTRLPGGRGPRITDDAIPAQEEQYQSRGTRVPVKKPYYFSTIASLYEKLEFFSFTALAVNINTFFLYQVDFDGVIDNVRFAQVAIQGGAPPIVGPKRAEFALYRYDSSGSNEFVQLPQTRFLAEEANGKPSRPNSKYSITTAPLPLDSPNISFSGSSQDLYLGFQVLDTSTAVLSLNRTSSEDYGFPVLARVLAVGEELPKRALFTSMTPLEDADVMVPQVKYATAFGAQLLGWQT